MIGAIRRLFQTQSDGPYFLGLQVVFNASGEEELRRRLVEVISPERPRDETPEQKGAFIRRVVSLLIQLEPAWAYCFWDYVDDKAERAVAEYKAWTLDIKSGQVLDEAEKGTEPEDTALLSTEKKYVAVSLLFLLEEPYTHAEITDEDLFFKRSTLRTLVENLVRIDPAGMRSGGVFVLPGKADDGLSEDDLLDKSWSYLREL